MRIPRSRGAVTGVILIVLGLVGALLPLVGPYFDFTHGADSAWNFSEAALWLSVLPGAVAVIGGVILLTSANRATAGIGAWLGLAAGAWFVVGEQISQLWNGGASLAGEAAGGTGQRVAEQLAFFDGLGVLIVAAAGMALGRMTLRAADDHELDRDTEVVNRDPGHDHDPGDDRPQPRTTRESGRFDRIPGADTPTSATTQTSTMEAADRVRALASGRRGRLFNKRDA